MIQFPNISPELFSFNLFGMEFALRWYALAYIVGILIGWRIVVRSVRNARLWPGSTAPIAPSQVEDLLTWVILGVILDVGSHGGGASQGRRYRRTHVHYEVKK